MYKKFFKAILYNNFCILETINLKFYFYFKAFSITKCLFLYFVIKKFKKSLFNVVTP